MRHVQRMQVGVALAAVLLCLTSGAVTVHATHESTQSRVSARTLSTALHVDENSDGVIEVFRELGQHQLPIAMLRPTDIFYGRFLDSIHHAVLTTNHPVKPVCFIVIYTKTGQACCILHTASNGELYDDRTKKTFKADRAFTDLLKKVTENRIS